LGREFPNETTKPAAFNALQQQSSEDFIWVYKPGAAAPALGGAYPAEC
jgi:hypothetical protein